MSIQDVIPETPIALQGSRIGLLSDSHGDVRMTNAALEALCARNPAAIIHLGDVCDDRVLEALAGNCDADGHEIPAFAVPGNMDDDPRALVRHGERMGVQVGHPALAFTSGGALLVAHHGHVRRVESAAHERGATHILHGHTHLVRDEQVNGVRMLNPGALHRAQRFTAAVLDLANGEFEVFEVSRTQP